MKLDEQKYDSGFELFWYILIIFVIIFNIVKKIYGKHGKFLI